MSILRKNIDDSKVGFKKDGVFKVRSGYGYDKIYLNSIDGSFDMIYQGFIHYTKYEEGERQILVYFFQKKYQTPFYFLIDTINLIGNQT